MQYYLDQEIITESTTGLIWLIKCKIKPILASPTDFTISKKNRQK